MIDKTTKVLLSLILIVLLALLLRPIISPAVAQTPRSASGSNVAVVEDSFGLYVVSNGYLSWWYPQPDLKGNGKLILRDSKPLPPAR